MKWWMTKKRIYLDYASATPMLSEVRSEMEKYFSEEFYNPNAIYEEGLRIKSEVNKFRRKIADILGAAEENIIFTSGGTEANVMTVRGIKGKVITEGEVHPSVTDAIEGRILDTDLPAGEAGSQGPTLISSVTTDNKLGRKIREERKKKHSEFPLLHIDASQTAVYFDVGLEKLACDLITLDSAKLYGPKGVGALVVRRGTELILPPRGTPAVPLIAGFAKALEIAAKDREKEFKRLSSLSAGFREELAYSLPEAEITYSNPHIINVSVPGILPELLVLALERNGVLVSAGPACNSNKPELPETPVRISLGRFTTEDEMRKAAKIFCSTAKNLLK
ncbi:MAG: hypothetical protein A2758_02095 [Candidatus Zambryskibacteria bacterium RIFCSPHIGHO2_01_FULL_49_18]|uniref:Aminotransferase class V domain-containing protein n=1 Tax=Candidatus Zambryskibacteria bacterium RIFCSPHIGHO2_01_FULL_49_18 TaxID=1802740 RepID=A0A1G2T350_9BACT|nr:MAG: hypothetical protein A2758_02095 [Candidatus Zambryskibacteria bacterium RIFCSPHIGHO2_01_FULL_49_18]